VHAKALTQVADRLLMCFDNDDAGQRAADRAVEVALRHKADVRVVMMTGGKDPADLIIGSGPEAFKSLLSSAIGALEFKWSATLRAYENGSERGKREALERFLSFVAKVSDAGGFDPLEQGLLIGRLSELLSLPTGSVYELLAKAKSQERRPAAASSVATDVLSGYDDAIRGTAPAIVVIAEELFGLAMMEPACFGRVSGPLASVADRCPAWQRLLGAMERLWENEGRFTREEVMDACDDEVLCELATRAMGRVGRGNVTAERCDAAIESLHREMEMVRGESLRGSLVKERSTDEQQHDAFRSLLEVMSKRQDVLGAEHRWNATPTS